MTTKEKTPDELTLDLVAQYAANRGCDCPYCGSSDIEGSAMTINTERVYQECRCNACGLAWTDGYTHDSVMGWDEADFTYFEEALKNRVVITIRGGVADVGSAPPGVEVQIVDFDNLEAEAAEEGGGQ